MYDLVRSFQLINIIFVASSVFLDFTLKKKIRTFTKKMLVRSDEKNEPNLPFYEPSKMRCLQNVPVNSYIIKKRL